MNGADKAFWVLGSLRSRVRGSELTTQIIDMVRGQTDLSITLDMLESQLKQSGLDKHSKEQIEEILRNSGRQD